MTDQMTFFHCTLKSRLPSILKDGIQPGRRRLWSNMFGAKLGQRGAIYVYDSFPEAVRWAFKMEWHLQKPVVILVVSDLGLRVPDPHGDPSMSGSFLTLQAIPAANITQVVPLTKELCKEVASTGTATLPPLSGEERSCA